MMNKISLSNRSLGFLILFWFIAAWYLFYSYFFVYNLVSIKIESNVDNYKINLNNLEFHNSFSYDCKEKFCDIDEISPFEYKIEFSKEWYDTVKQKIDLKTSIELSVKLEKTVILEKIEKISTVSVIEEITEEITEENKTREEIIALIKRQKENYAIIETPTFWEFFIKEQSGNINIFYKEKNIWTFPLVAKEDIKIKEIYGNKEYIYIDLGEKKYLINLIFYKVSKLDLNLDILYIKQSNKDKELQIVTDKWTFLYDFKWVELTYFSRFYDFVYIDSVYVAVIKSDDTIRKQNMWYKKNSWNLIVSFNPETKEKRLLKEVDFNINKILIKKEEVIFTSEGEEEYNLKGY